MHMKESFDLKVCRATQLATTESERTMMLGGAKFSIILLLRDSSESTPKTEQNERQG